MCPPVEVDDDMAGDGLAGSIALDVGDRRFYFSPSRDSRGQNKRKSFSRICLPGFNVFFFCSTTPRINRLQQRPPLAPTDISLFVDRGLTLCKQTDVNNVVMGPARYFYIAVGI